ncbi:hypothetical protein PInf_022170 [Phytophthora infestans]|nr:hypothetical protein PInf_022170 [Phytophthora infestans]
MPPGKNVKGGEGVDYFRGEQAVLEHYAKELRRHAVGVQPSVPGDDQLAAAAIATFTITASADASLIDEYFKSYGKLPNDANEDREDSALGSELLADSTDDLNVVIDHAIEHQFGKLDSGAEAETDDMETGECVSGEEAGIYCASVDIGDYLAATEDEITAEVHFAENFLDILVEKTKFSLET